MLVWHTSKRVLDDPAGSNYSQAVDPGTLLKLLLYDKTCEFAIEETTASLKKTSPAQERWPDPSYWDLKAKLELELTLEVRLSADARLHLLIVVIVDDSC